MNTLHPLTCSIQGNPAAKPVRLVIRLSLIEQFAIAQDSLLKYRLDNQLTLAVEADDITVFKHPARVPGAVAHRDGKVEIWMVDEISGKEDILESTFDAIALAAATPLGPGAFEVDMTPAPTNAYPRHFFFNVLSENNIAPMPAELNSEFLERVREAVSSSKNTSVGHEVATCGDVALYRCISTIASALVSADGGLYLRAEYEGGSFLTLRRDVASFLKEADDYIRMEKCVAEVLGPRH